MRVEYLLVGGGIASANAIEGIRSLDNDHSIALVSEEPYPPYFRPLISYYLSGRVEENRLPWRPREYYQEMGLALYLDCQVAALDLEKKEAVLNHGNKLFFNKLLLATGGAPAKLPIPGADLDGVFSFTSWKSAALIKQYLDRNRVDKATIIGGGLIGLKAAEALSYLGVRVSVVELVDHLLPVVLDREAGELLALVLEQKGWNIACGRKVDQITGLGRAAEVTLDDGTVLGADLVIMAGGVRPNIELARQAGLSVNHGLLVDDYLQTGCPDVYAAGDAAESWDLVTGERKVLALWPVAVRQGYLAGQNMAGDRQVYPGGMAMNSTSLGGFPVMTVGLSNVEDDGAASLTVVKEMHQTKRYYRKLVFRGDRLVGAILMGGIERAGLLTGLVQDGWPVRDLGERLINSEFNLLDLPPEYRDHLINTARFGGKSLRGDSSAN